MKDEFLEIIANEDISKLFYRIFFNSLIELEFVLFRDEDSRFRSDVILFKAVGNEKTKELVICCNQYNIKQAK